MGLHETKINDRGPSVKEGIGHKKVMRNLTVGEGYENNVVHDTIVCEQPMTVTTVGFLFYSRKQANSLYAVPHKDAKVLSGPLGATVKLIVATSADNRIVVTINFIIRCILMRLKAKDYNVKICILMPVTEGGENTVEVAGGVDPIISQNCHYRSHRIVVIGYATINSSCPSPSSVIRSCR